MHSTIYKTSLSRFSARSRSPLEVGELARLIANTPAVVVVVVVVFTHNSTKVKRRTPNASRGLSLVCERESLCAGARSLHELSKRLAKLGSSFRWFCGWFHRISVYIFTSASLCVSPYPASATEKISKFPSQWNIFTLTLTQELYARSPPFSVCSHMHANYMRLTNNFMLHNNSTQVHPTVHLSKSELMTICLISCKISLHSQVQHPKK